MLAALLLRRGTAVPVEWLGRLISRTTVDDHGPAAERRDTTADVLLDDVRRRLAGARSDALALTQAGTHWTAVVAPGVLDLAVAQELVERGTAALAAGRPQAAADDLRAAVDLFPEDTENLLQELTGAWFADERERLVGMRDSAALACATAEAAAGRADAALRTFQILVRRHPLREDLCEALMKMLWQAGRRHDALAAYDAHAQRLRRDLGASPGPTVQMLRRRLLDASG